MKKLLIIGLDGVSYSLLKNLMDFGYVSIKSRNFKLYPLESVIPPITPSAWTSSYTGLCPNQHKIVGFFHRDDKNNVLIPNDASKNVYPTYWEILDILGFRNLIITMPFTYPVNRNLANTAIISGFPHNEFNYHPKDDNMSSLLKKHNFEIFVSRDVSFKDYFLHINKRFDLFNELLAKNRYDLAALGIGILEEAHHKNFIYHKAFIKKLYRYTFIKIDKLLNEYHDYNFIIYSDHGHKEFRYSFNLVAFLTKYKLLYLRNYKIARSSRAKIYSMLFRYSITGELKRIYNMFNLNHRKKINTDITVIQEILYNMKESVLFPYIRAANCLVCYINEPYLKYKNKILNMLDEILIKKFSRCYNRVFSFSDDVKDPMIVIELKEDVFAVDYIFSDFDLNRIVSKCRISNHEMNGILLTDLDFNMNFSGFKLTNIFKLVMDFFDINVKKHPNYQFFKNKLDFNFDNIKGSLVNTDSINSDYLSKLKDLGYL